MKRETANGSTSKTTSHKTGGAARRPSPRPRRLTSPVHHRRPRWWERLLRRLPRWAWWAGGALVVAGYAWFFYFIFLSPGGLRWRPLYGRVSYPEGYDIHGIDISHYQGDIDWQRLRDEATIDDSPVSFVMIKATEGADRLDERFAYNFAKARQHGFMRGAYHFFTTQSSAEAQARFFFQNVSLEDGDLPPVLDVERKPKQQSREAFKDGVLQWLRMAERHYGVKPILYTYFKFKKEYLSDPAFDQYPYWIAHYYVDSLTYDGPWHFWQHTDRGSLPGIKGDVDFNIYNGSYYDLRQMAIGSREEAED